MVKFTVEYTDTFGGEANYCWVKRDSFILEADCKDKDVKSFAKDLMGLKGVRGRWEDYGDSYSFRPYRSNTVLFVNVEAF